MNRTEKLAVLQDGIAELVSKFQKDTESELVSVDLQHIRQYGSVTPVTTIVRCEISYMEDTFIHTIRSR